MIENLGIGTLKVLDYISFGSVYRRLVSQAYELTHSGEHGEAVNAFNLARNVNWERPQAQMGFAVENYRSRGGNNVSCEDPLEISVNALDIAIKDLKKAPPEAHLMRASFSAGEAFAAMSLKNPELESHLAASFDLSKKYKPAVDSYTEGLKGISEPYASFVAFDRGSLLYFMGNITGAEANFKKINEVGESAGAMWLAQEMQKIVEKDPERKKRRNGKDIFEELEPAAAKCIYSTIMAHSTFHWTQYCFPEDDKKLEVMMRSVMIR